MDSLDAVPSADYASLLTLSPPNETALQFTVDRNQNFNKPNQVHIYAQVTQNGHCHGNAAPCQESKTSKMSKVEVKSKVNLSKTCLPDTSLLRSSALSLSHSNSAPDVRRPYPNLPSLCPNSYGSLNVTKVDSKVLKKETETSNDSSVFSISGRRVVVSSGFKGNNDKKKTNGIHLPSTTVDVQNERASVWSRRSSVDSQTETKRRKLQVCTDCFSLCLFVPGTVLCILSPWLLVPIYIIPNFSGSHFQTLIWISCIGSAILVFMGCMVGNLVWYRKGEDWKCRLHCGKGPKNHYWGDSLTSRRTLHTV
ncbi:uncharacterized protein LOC118188304 [Stegodyphus dumicola]|uniref:uncharacterized protein LOC118188304 n=1 Tax=Stegodyphus dumicola TaxID=202533 RepID=UPI0015B2EEAC|nr:uncharacterized protein LOC118188304 [Stegodyphus dumicola]XP_035214618.1 uncharacterized protein LOC118188304 [Stegodyphus dumicola]